MRVDRWPKAVCALASRLLSAGSISGANPVERKGEVERAVGRDWPDRKRFQLDSFGEILPDPRLIARQAATAVRVLRSIETNDRELAPCRAMPGPKNCADEARRRALDHSR